MAEPYQILATANEVLTSDLVALLATIVLGVIHLGMSSILTLGQLKPTYILSARDELQEPTGLAGRVARAYRNFLENFSQFATALFLVHISATNAELSVIGAWTFFWGRVAYIPAYAFAPPGIRPLCWMAAQIGVLLILADIFV